MDNIIEYTKKGKKFYKFKVYTGINPNTGKKSQTTKSGFTTKAAAKSARRKIQAEVANGTYWEDINNDVPTNLSELIEEYMNVKRPSVKPSTMRSIGVKAKRFKKLAAYKLNSIKSKDIQNIISSNEALSTSTKNDTLIFIRRVFGYAQQMGYIKLNPVETIERFKDISIKTDKKNFYEPEELKLFLKTIKDESFKYYAFYRLAAFSGMRIGEICGLEWKDVNFTDNTITVRQTASFNEQSKVILLPPKTENSFRTIEMDSITMSTLKEWREETRRLNSFVFGSLKRNEPSYPAIASAFLTSFFKRHPEIHAITPHGFRHTHASMLFKQGINPKVIQKRLGHATLEMTLNVYTHLFEDFEEDEINKLIANIEDKFKDS